MDEGEERNNAILSIMSKLRSDLTPEAQFGMAPVNAHEIPKN